MGHVYCATLSSGTDKMVTVSGGGEKTHRMKVLQLKHMTNGFQTSHFLISSIQTTVEQVRASKCDECVSHDGSQFKKQKQTPVPSGPICLASATASCGFLEYHLSKLLSHLTPTVIETLTLKLQSANTSLCRSGAL